jgi:hypothetical protein
VTSAVVLDLLNASHISRSLQSLALTGLNMSGSVPALSSRYVALHGDMHKSARCVPTDHFR